MQRERGALWDVRAIAVPVFQADDAVAAIAVSLTAADHATTDPRRYRTHARAHAPPLSATSPTDPASLPPASVRRAVAVSVLFSLPCS
jgi:hypothetical protein